MPITDLGFDIECFDDLDTYLYLINASSAIESAAKTAAGGSRDPELISMKETAKDLSAAIGTTKTCPVLEADKERVRQIQKNIDTVDRNIKELGIERMVGESYAKKLC